MIQADLCLRISYLYRKGISSFIVFISVQNYHTNVFNFMPRRKGGGFSNKNHSDKDFFAIFRAGTTFQNSKISPCHDHLYFFCYGLTM